MISDIVEIAHDLSTLGKGVGNVGGAAGNALTALQKTELVKSISEKAKRSVMMYKVLLSGGIREIELASKINKYLENMYSCFTLLVLGYNPTTSASDNSGLNAVISGVSAEAFGANAIDQKTLKTQEAAFVEASREFSFVSRSEESSAPRIGKGAINSGATSEEGFWDSVKSKFSSDKNNGPSKSPIPWELNNGYHVPKDERDAYNHGLDEGEAIGRSQGRKEGRDEAIKDLVDPKKSLFGQGVAYAKSQNEKIEAVFAERVKAANKGEPTIIKMKVATGSGNTIEVPIAIKCNMYAIGTEELRLLIESGISGKASSYLRKMKWKTGEISTAAWILGTDYATRDKKLYEKLGRNPWYIELQKRKLSSKAGWWTRFLSNFRKESNKANGISSQLAENAFEVSGYRGDIPPTASLIVTKEDIVAATRLNIDHFTKNEGFVAKFMQDSFLLCFGIVDNDLEQASFFFMGYKEPFVVTFKELENKGDNPDEDLYKAIATLSKKV